MDIFKNIKEFFIPPEEDETIMKSVLQDVSVNLNTAAAESMVRIVLRILQKRETRLSTFRRQLSSR